MKMVDLTAGNMVATATRNRREWGEELTRILTATGVEYAVGSFIGLRSLMFQLITSVQLVGVCLYLFVHPETVSHLSDVSIGEVKTGAGGNLGNKGGVSVRMKLFNSRQDLA